MALKIDYTMTKTFFITSTGTNIGKTLLTCALCQQTIQNGKKTLAIKPIISGWGENDNSCDTIQILKSQNLEVNKQNIDKISPWRFSAPLSPDIAAKHEGKEIDFNKLVNFCLNSKKDNDYLFVEGVGGIMVPINNDKTILDLIKSLNFEVILTAGTYLGSISHTLSAIEVLKNNNINLHSLVISESENSPTSIEDHLSTIKNFYNGKIVVINRIDEVFSKTIWTNVGNLCEKLI